MSPAKMPTPAPGPPVNAASSDDAVPAVAGTSVAPGIYIPPDRPLGGGMGVSGTSGSGIGVMGQSNSDVGVVGACGTPSTQEYQPAGVIGSSLDGTGVYGLSDNFDGVKGMSLSAQHAGVGAQGGPQPDVQVGRDGRRLETRRDEQAGHYSSPTSTNDGSP